MVIRDATQHVMAAFAEALGAAPLEPASHRLIDLGGADVTKWLELLHLLAARPEGPQHLRLTPSRPFTSTRRWTSPAS